MCKGVTRQGWQLCWKECAHLEKACVYMCEDHMQLCVHSMSLRLCSDTEFQCVQQRVSVRSEAGFNRPADGVSGVW